ncbi:MAG: allantoicase, partial [Chthoniobacterales bacterium]
MSEKDSTPAGLIDLAAARVGGVALLANDEFFAEKENLLRPGRGIFIPDKYTDRGKWMDGWESRRRRTPGNDWCVIQLGLRGIIRQVDIDTNHFLGNHPPFASLDAVCLTNGFPKDPDQLAWTSVLEKSPLNPGSQNLFAITSEQTWTHVRLNIFPDGGVARFRVYGIVVPDWS